MSAAESQTPLQAAFSKYIGSQAVGYTIAGGVAGAVSRTVAAPFERLKILYQVQDLATSEGKQKYRGIYSSLVHIGKEEGIRGYFKGNFTNVVRIIPYSSVQFLTYEKYKTFIAQYCPNGELNTPGRLAAGALAGMSSVFASYPLDLVRCRLSAQNEATAAQAGQEVRYRGIVHALRVILREEGLRGYFKGISPTLMGIAPYVGLNFTFYEALKKRAPREEGARDPSVPVRLVIGAISGTVAQTITYPLDVIRRRMQMDGFGGHARLYNGTFDAFAKIIKANGFLGLYKGLIPNYMKVVPVVSVSFVVYEGVKKQLGLGGGGGDL